MDSEVRKAVIQLLNEQIRKCKSDADCLKLAGKILGAKLGKKKLYDKLGLELDEEDPAPVDEEPPADPEPTDGEG
jgi:hypothetical protein